MRAKVLTPAWAKGLVAALSTLFVAAEAQADCGVLTDADVRQTISEMRSAHDARDASAVMRFYDSRALLEVQDMPVRAYADIERAYRGQFATSEDGPPPLSYEIDQVLISGSQAVVVATQREREIRNGQTSAVRELHGVDIFERSADCQLRIVRSLHYWRLPR